MADNDFFEDEEEQPEPVADNKDAIIQRLQKKAEKLEAKIEEARKAAFDEATKSFERKNRALEVGGGLGLKPRAIETFLKENPEADISPEAIKPWAEEYGFPVQTTESEQTEPPVETKAPPAAASFHAGGGGTSTGAGPMTWAEFSEKSKADPAAAAQEAQKRGLQQLGGLGELTPA